MKRLSKFIFVLCVLGLISSEAFAQVDSLRAKFNKFRVNNPQEKIYVHTDQELYLTGETLWMKIYCVDGALHVPSDLSKVAYVEVVDQENKVILQGKVALKDGGGKGTLFIPASISSGNYQLRAYTQWMKNFGPGFFFHKQISIVNSFRAPERTNATEVAPITAQFYPEGGNLVSGLESKVAIKVTDRNQRGVSFSGIVVNENNDTICSFQPLKFGMGHFRFTPEAGTYRAIITDSLGRSQTFSLPRPKGTGVVMHLRDSTLDNVTIEVSRSEGASIHSTFYVIHARQIIAAAGSASFRQGKAVIQIPRQQLQEGISHITLFDESMQPLAERLYFKPSLKKLAITAIPQQKEYGVRRKVLIDLSAANIDLAGDATLSVAVAKRDSLQQGPTGNIFEYLWLTSDLQGTIESSAYYVNSDNDEVRQAIDHLMLTHGWRRFEWSNVLSEKTNQHSFIPEYRGHLIRAKVLGQDRKPAAGIATYLSSPGKIIQLYTGRSNSNGDVQFEMKDFFGPRKIFVTANTSQDTTVKISIENPFSQDFTARAFPPLKLDEGMAQKLERRSVAMQVQDIYYGDHAVKYDSSRADSTAFYGTASETYYLDDYTRFPVMEEVMREYVPGVMVRKRRDGFHFIVLDNVRKSVFRDNPLVILDGVPIFDIDDIMEFDPLKVKKLEVVTSRYFLGPIVFPGVVSYSTYNGDLGGFQVDPRSITLDYEGLQRERVFYAPVYENEKQRQSRMPDRRNLLWWEPSVKIDENGKALLEFYTSDLTGQYTIFVEGITSEGYAGSAMSTFTVKDFSN